MLSRTYQHAVFCNNTGVACLEHGDLPRALSAFKTALNSMTTVISDLEKSKRNLSPKSSSSWSPNSLMDFCVQWSANAKLPLHMEGAVSGSASFVYRRAIRIYSTPLTAATQRDNFVDESAIVVYNLALAFHLSGVNNNTEFLRRAIRFYEIANSILQRQREQPSNQLKSVLLNMAVLNNMGQIRHSLMEFEQARKCFSEVSTILVNLNQAGLLTQCLTPADCDGFVLNVTLKEPSVAAAA
uniref:Uncharacterized protein n=1 Tax=Cyclophora tenuis TaxID=216820 RepID=A0A7S1GNN8_CYCTE|mmetsp:Transcript_2607/g.4470  ORF Transcript_2607/g.4470 Transcript_2607/m.4470 type:complete len:241 (+) Transcript_2607:42-764(+)